MHETTNAPSGYVNQARKLNVVTYIYKTGKVEFDKTVNSLRTNQQLLTEGVNNSLFCWLDETSQQEVREFLKLKIQNYPDSYPKSCLVEMEHPDSFINWGIVRLQPLIIEALFNQQYDVSADDLFRTHRNMHETVLHESKGDSKLFRECLHSSRNWVAYAEGIKTALYQRDQLRVDDFALAVPWPKEIFDDHSKAISHCCDRLKDLASKPGNQGMQHILLDYHVLEGSRVRPKTILGFINLMTETIMSVEAKLLQMKRYTLHSSGPSVPVEVPSAKKPKYDQPVNPPVEVIASIVAAKQASAAAAKCFNCGVAGHKKHQCTKPPRKKAEVKPPGKQAADKKKNDKGKLVLDGATIMVCSDSTPKDVNITYINNSLIDIVYQEEIKSVNVLVDTGAVAGNYINSSVAAWLISKGYVAKAERSMICSCTDECTVASRKVFFLTVNNNKFEKPLHLRFVEFETPFEMIIGMNDSKRYGLVDILIVPSAEHIAVLQEYIHPFLCRISATTNNDSCVRVAAPTQLLLTDQSNLTGPTVVKTAGHTESLTVCSSVGKSCGLATDNLKKVGLTPKLASSKVGIERHTSTSVVKPCCNETRHCSMGDLVADSCTVCSLRVSKADLLDYEPEGEEVVMEEQEDFFDAFPGERERDPIAGAENETKQTLPPDENIHGSSDLQRKIKALCAKHSRAFSTTVRKTPARVSACLLYTSPSPRDRTRSRMPSSA